MPDLPDAGGASGADRSGDDVTDAAGPSPRRRRVWWWVVGGAVAVGALIAALVFQPWLLFIDVRVDDEIPVEHYHAVAEIIGYVMGLKRGLSGQRL